MEGYIIMGKENIHYITEDEIRNNAEHNKKFLNEVEEELKKLKDNNGHITDGDIARILGIKGYV